ncbi:uncharacterized protein LOC119830763 isoform X2 [Zerene cesonia]|uniref:uncharacterized protein LOC119830763 isoform X2 n=1 Tax=Zerene cesonia TaxID=33412 RepID=UPI0018E4F093|nr:uncharacterized protein LOC119830763 isoform X2 [Zerene cesonia]
MLRITTRGRHNTIYAFSPFSTVSRDVSSLEEMFCQTRPYGGNEHLVEVVAAKALEIWWHDWDKSSSEVDTPLLLSCPVREPINENSIVSVVTEPCEDPSNGFNIKPNGNVKYIRSFTVCVKDMNFREDVSHSLTEWIETNKILGADLVDIYVDSVNKNTETVLLRYQSAGFVRLFQVPIKNTIQRTLWQRRRDHIITYNDCLYRNIIESKFIIPLDIDEILLPKIAYTWHGLLKRLPFLGWDPYQHSAILVKNVFFFDFMQDLYKNKAISITRNNNKIYVKRDDVRIDDPNNFNVNEIELEDGTNSLSKENKNDYIAINAYDSGCLKAIPLPKIARSIISSATISPLGHYSKSFMLTKRVLTAFNHYPLASIGATGFTGWAAPLTEVQLNHYKESCNETIIAECWQYVKRTKVDRSALRLKRRLTRAVADALCK